VAVGADVAFGAAVGVAGAAAGLQPVIPKTTANNKPNKTSFFPKTGANVVEVMEERWYMVEISPMMRRK
jgi:hypothetical protein